MIDKILISLAPLAVLMVCIGIACILGFLLLMGLGDVLSIERIVNKGTQLFLVLSLLPFKKYLGLQWRDFGFNGKRLFYRQLAYGLLTGLIILGPIIILLYSLDVRYLKPDKVWTFGIVFKTALGSLLAALAISCLEEPVFRGLLLTSLQRKLGVMAAILLSAIYYGGLHFLKTDLDIPYDQLHWYSAFQLVGDALLNPFQWKQVPAFMALFTVGLFLGMARLYAGLGLGFCIGCHTGWVFLIKITKSMSNVDVDNPYFFLVSHYDGVIGLLVCAWLTIALLAYYLLNKPKITFGLE